MSADAVLVVRKWSAAGAYAWAWASADGKIGQGGATARHHAVELAASDIATRCGMDAAILVETERDLPAAERGAPMLRAYVGEVGNLTAKAERRACEVLVQMATGRDWRKLVDWSSAPKIARTIMSAIGGVNAVAALLMVSPVTVCRWYARGVPAHQVDAVCALVPGLTPAELRPDLKCHDSPNL